MTPLLETLNNYLQKYPKTLFYMWNVPEFEDATRVRLEYCPITVVSGTNSGAYRIYGASVKDVDGIYRVVFEEDLVRIKNGARRNCVMPISAIKSDETAVKAGLQKKLLQTEQSFGFSQNRENDIKFLMSIADIPKSPIIATEKWVTPRFYISTKHPSTLYPRACAKMLNTLMSTDGYSSYDPVVLNFKKLAPILFDKIDNFYKCDYTLVYGKGMVVADASEVAGKIFSISVDNTDQCADEYTRIRVRRMLS